MDAIWNFSAVILGAGIVTLFEWIKSKRESIDKFKLVALDKRLAAHQKAYEIMVSLAADFFFLKKESPEKISLKKLADFLNKNCLYLDKESWSAINHTIFVMAPYKKASPAARKPLEKKLIKEINEAMICLMKGVNLPPIGNIEKSFFKND